MTKEIKDLEKDAILNNKEITEIFHCQYEGGVRKSKKMNLLVLINDPKYGLYQNRWKDDILYFTAIGRKGNQSLEQPWQNRDLAHYKENKMKLYLFEKQKPSKYAYKGEVQVVDEPFQEKQEDEEGKERKVYVFKLKLVEKN